jgi:hypothetical protein
VAQHDAIPALLWTFGFGAVAIGGVLAFLYFDRRRTIKAVTDLAAQGVAVVGTSPPALAGGMELTRTTAELRIDGPSTLSVGVTAEYDLDPAPPAGATVSWTVNGCGTLDKKDQPKAQLTTTGVGTAALSVTVAPGGGAADQEAALPVRVVGIPGPAGLTDRIPFLGSGYGTVVIALSVASVTAALGLTDVLDGQAVAGILGSLVTYSVIRAVGGAGGGSTGSGQSGSGGSSHS